jgi:IS5 family transposase
MKAHIGVDAESGLVHTIQGTAANVHDIVKAHALLHGKETVVYGDAGYRGIQKRKNAKAVHPFRVIKLQFGFAKARYRGLKKNTAQLTTLFALSNLWMARRKLMKM